MKTIPLILSLLFATFSLAQPYNLVPCPDFECVEYFLPFEYNECQNSPCCDKKLYIRNVEDVNEMVQFVKYAEFHCGPWQDDTRGDQVANVGFAATLCSSSINQLYSYNEVYNMNAEYWNQDETGCISDFGDCVGNKTICPSEFSVPNSTFGKQISNINVPDNKNYVGLRSGGIFLRRDGIKIKLTEKLIPCITYVFECDAVRKTGSETQFKFRVTTDGSWNDDEGGEESLSISNSNMDDAPWQHFYDEFEVDNEGEWLHLRIKGPNNPLGFRTALFDNIKLYKKCDKENFDFSCVNYNSSTGDYVTVFESHNSSTPLTFYNLANLDVAILEISSNGSEIASYSVLNPPHSISWDGKSMQGDNAANATYQYKLKTRNGCSPLCIKEGNFTKTDDYNGNLVPVVYSSEGLLSIAGLINATFLQIKIFQGNVLIREININNPRDVVSWDNKDEFNNFVNNGDYLYKLLISNPCESKTIEGTFNKTSNILSSPSFDYSTQFRNLSLMNCGYLTNPSAVYFKPPVECCIHEPNITLANVVLDGQLLISVSGVINIGTNVSITPGSNITFRAGVGVEGVSNLEFEPSLGATYSIEIIPCPLRIAGSDDVNLTTTKDYSIKENRSNEILPQIIPNPNDGEFILKTFANFDVNNISIFANDGRTIPFEIISKNNEGIKLRVNTESTGVYLLKYNSISSVYTSKVIVAPK